MLTRLLAEKFLMLLLRSKLSSDAQNGQKKGPQGCLFENECNWAFWLFHGSSFGDLWRVNVHLLVYFQGRELKIAAHSQVRLKISTDSLKSKHSSEGTGL